MSVYNGASRVRAAVDSILSQTFSDFELLVIDDGSIDGTRALLESYEDTRIRLVSRENQGLTRSLNEGLAIARGALIARQDADDVSLPTRLEREVRLLDAN